MAAAGEPGARRVTSLADWQIEDAAARQPIVRLLRDLLRFENIEKGLVAQMWEAAPRSDESTLEALWSTVSMRVDPMLVSSLTGQVTEMWEG
jgi:hypothetical protein